jgi:hypothetical protein
MVNTVATGSADVMILLSSARAEVMTLPKVDTNCSAPSLIPTVNGNTARSFSTRGQRSAAQGSSTTVSRSDIRLIQYSDSSAHGLVRRWRLTGYFPIQHLLAPSHPTRPLTPTSMETKGEYCPSALTGEGAVGCEQRCFAQRLSTSTRAEVTDEGLRAVSTHQHGSGGGGGGGGGGGEARARQRELLQRRGVARRVHLHSERDTVRERHGAVRDTPWERHPAGETPSGRDAQWERR